MEDLDLLLGGILPFFLLGLAVTIYDQVKAYRRSRDRSAARGCRASPFDGLHG